MKILKVDELSSDGSNYIKLKRMKYSHNGRERDWDFIKSHDSVATLLFDYQKQAFLLVKQFRPAVFSNNSETDGYTYELCAGLVDKDEASVEEIAIMEISEECGYQVELNQLERVTSFYTSVGLLGAKQTIFFAEINDAIKIELDKFIPEEGIELYWLLLNEAKQFLFDESKPKTSGLLFAFYWFFEKQLCFIQ